MAVHIPHLSNLALVLDEIRAKKESQVTSPVSDERPASIEQLPNIEPHPKRPSKQPPPPPSKKMDALNETINKLQLEQQSGPSNEAKYLSKECKKYLKKGKRGKGPCRCPICLPTGSASLATPET